MPNAATRDSRTASAGLMTSSPCPCSAPRSGTGWATSSTAAKPGTAGQPGDVVTSEGDLVTGIETAAAKIVTRGVLLDVGRALGPELGRTDGELPDGFAITPEHLERTIERQGPSSAVRRGDIVVIRTGQYTRVRREGWGDYAGGSAPGLSFTTAAWLHASEIAGIATDTWGFEVRPNEFEGAFQPLHQIAIPNLGLFLGEMWDPDATG